MKRASCCALHLAGHMKNTSTTLLYITLMASPVCKALQFPQIYTRPSYLFIALLLDVHPTSKKTYFFRALTSRSWQRPFFASGQSARVIIKISLWLGIAIEQARWLVNIILD